MLNNIVSKMSGARCAARGCLILEGPNKKKVETKGGELFSGFDTFGWGYLRLFKISWQVSLPSQLWAEMIQYCVDLRGFETTQKE